MYLCYSYTKRQMYGDGGHKLLIGSQSGNKIVYLIQCFSVKQKTNIDFHTSAICVERK